MPALVSPVLIGRTQERAAIEQAYERAAAGDPAVVLVGGEAGVGKTRLVSDIAQRAEDAGARVLTGACVQLGGEGLPFAPLVDILRALAHSSRPDQLDALLGAARSQLAPLLPELGTGDEAPADPRGSARLFEIVLGVARRLAAERPLVLVVEDLHWADRSTLDLVAFLVHALRGIPVLLVATFRSDELHRGHPLRPLLASLERVRSVERVELAPFTRGEVAAQAEAILRAPADRQLAERVYERSEGNAFLVEELLGIVQSGGSLDRLPPSLRDLLLARAEQLPDDARQVVRVAAVAGRRIPERLLGAVAGLDDPARVAALRDAVERQVLVVDDAGYAFRHALVRDAVYDELLPTERTRLHTAYADAVDADASLAGDEAAAAAALAHHRYAAHDVPRALAAAVQAAHHATGAYAHAEAHLQLERVLELWPQVPDAEERAGMERVAVVELAVGAAVSAGNDARALALSDEILVELRERDPTRAALLLERRAEAARWSGGHGLAELEEAARLLPAEPPTAELARILAALSTTVMYTGDMAQAGALAERAVAAARSAGAPAEEAAALITLGTALAHDGAPDDARATLNDGLRVATEIGDTETVLRAHANLSDLLELAGRHEEAIATSIAGLEFAERVGNGEFRYGPFLTGNAADPLFRLGRWTEADHLLASAVARHPLGDRSLVLFVLRGLIAVAEGRLEDAVRHAELVRQVPIVSHPLTRAAVALLEIGIAHANDDLAAARAIAEKALADPEGRRLARITWPLAWWALRIEADLATRDRDRRQPPSPQTRARTDELAALVRETPVSTGAEAGYARLAEAELARVDGKLDPIAWRSAVAAWREAGEPHPLAYALLRLGEAEVATGDREAARAAVGEAAQIAERLGAAPLVRDAAALARGARLASASAPAAPDAAAEDAGDELGLTERERHVLRLIALGRTNRQIAAELFISPKTASVHVSNILRKLGVSSRVEAATAAHRLGLAA